MFYKVINSVLCASETPFWIWPDKEGERLMKIKVHNRQSNACALDVVERKTKNG